MLGRLHPSLPSSNWLASGDFVLLPLTLCANYIVGHCSMCYDVLSFASGQHFRLAVGTRQDKAKTCLYRL